MTDFSDRTDGPELGAATRNVVYVASIVSGADPDLSSALKLVPIKLAPPTDRPFD